MMVFFHKNETLLWFQAAEEDGRAKCRKMNFFFGMQGSKIQIVFIYAHS